MSGKFIATPHTAAGAVVDLAPAVGLKTILQVNVPAASQITILGWGISIAGTVASDVPFYAYLMSGDVAASVGTSLTADPFDAEAGFTGSGTSLCIGGAALTSYNAAYTEGTIAASRFFDTQRVHPQTGYSVWFPTDVRPLVGLIASARFVRIRVNAVTTAYNIIPWIVWDE
jgi:hypothetical protein